MDEGKSELNRLVMKLQFTYDMVFSFEGPNLCLLGKPKDFHQLALEILTLTTYNSDKIISITSLDYVENIGDDVEVKFESSPGGSIFGKIVEEKLVIFTLDSRIWERIFKYFVLMSWNKATYYLNSFEDCLRDLPLDQECHLICSSEF